jgi:hypothetical protein
MEFNQLVHALEKRVSRTFNKKIAAHFAALKAGTTKLRDLDLVVAQNPSSEISGECNSISAGDFALPAVGTPVLPTDGANREYVDNATVLTDKGLAVIDGGGPADIEILSLNSLEEFNGNNRITFFYNFATGTIKIANTPVSGPGNDVNFGFNIGRNYTFPFGATQSEPTAGLLLIPNSNAFLSTDGLLDSGFEMSTNPTFSLYCNAFAEFVGIDKMFTVFLRFQRGVTSTGTIATISGLAESTVFDIPTP